jgi:hypothetical protein
MACLKVRLLLPGSAEVQKSGEDLLRQTISGWSADSQLCAASHRRLKHSTRSSVNSLHHHPDIANYLYRVFQKELFNFESL